MPEFLHDLRYALRTLRRSVGITLVIVVSLAIGIGANTAVFSVVNALLLKPLPYPDPERLVVLWLRSPGINIPQDWPSPGQYIDVQTENRSFDEMSISQGRSGTLLGLDEPQRVEALLTQSSLFHLLGAKPLYGRLLLAEEDRPGRAPVVILSHGFWRRVFGSEKSEALKPQRLDYLNEAMALERQGDFEAALTSYKLALRDNPHVRAQLLNNLQNVRGQEYGRSPRHITAQHVSNHARCHRIDPFKRLVQEQQVRIGQKCGG